MATKPVEIEILLKDRLSGGLDVIQRKLDAMMAGATSAEQRVRLLETAIGVLNVQLEALKETGTSANPDLDQGKNIAAIEQIEAKITELQAQLKSLDETAENTHTVPPDAGQSVKQYNGLHMSIQQIAREMPSLAMGPQMFFLAISNNLPIFTDELARARKEYEALTASGQKATPVWKQVLSSLLSWQTALTTGIMLLVMYGNQIADWVSGLFKAQQETDAMAEEQRVLNAAMGEARSSAAKETAQLTLLYKMTQNTNASLRNRQAAVAELQRQYPAYFGNLSQEAILAGEAAGQYRQLANDIMQAAYARAYQKRIEDLAEQNVGLQRAINADTNWTQRNRADYQRRLSRIRLSAGAQESAALNSTDAAAAVATGAIERQTGTVISEYIRRTAALEKNWAQLAANEQAMQSYEQEVLKRQNPLMQTTQDSTAAKSQQDTVRVAKERADEEKRIADERKKAQDANDRDLLSLEQKNQEDEIALMRDGAAKKIAEINHDYAQRKAEIDRQEAEFKRKNRESGLTGLGADGLTDEQAAALQQARDLAAKAQERETQELYASEAAAMRNYLKEYGTFQQQKLAIAEEYADKISKAQTDGERLTLTAARNRELQQVEVSAIKREVDWGSVFGDFGTMFKEQLEPTIDRLRVISESDTFKQGSLDDQKTLYDLIAKLENANAVWDGDTFKRVSGDIKAYESAMQNYTNAVDKARDAEENLVQAERNLREAKAGSADEATVKAAEASLNAARNELDAASSQVKTFSGQVEQTTATLNSSAAAAQSMFSNLAAGLQGLSSGNLKGIGEGVMKLDSLFGGDLKKEAGNALAKGFQSLLGKDSEAAKSLTEALGDTGLAGEITTAILGIFDLLAENGIGGIVSNLTDTVLGSVSGILDDVLSGQIITKPLESVVKGVGGLLNTLTFGGLKSWFGGNDKEVTDTVNRLTESNEGLKKSIDGLAERIGESGSTTSESIDYYNQARKAEQEWEENQREIIKSLAGAWTNSGYGFLGLGGKHSFDSNAPDSTWEGWDAFTETLQQHGLNITLNCTDALWNLTPEEMALLRDNNPAEWQALFSSDGHRNPQDAVNEYIDRAGTLDELTNSLNEKLTGYSWDGFLGKYKEMIKDAESTTEDFADFINNTVSDALTEAFVNEQLKDDIRDLYDYIATASADGISADEKEEIEKKNNAIAESAMSWREAMEAAGMISKTDSGTGQTGKAGSFNAMSQDQGTKLEGLFTSGLMHWSSMDEKIGDVSEQMGAAADSLRRIEENTGASASYLGAIKEELVKIVRDGLKIR